MADTDKLRPEVKEIPDEILDRAEAVYDEAIDELDGFSTCSRFALGEAIALALSEVNRPAGEPGVAIEWLRRFVVCNPVSSIETWREYSKLAAGFVETVSAELLRLAGVEAELVALKARMLPGAAEVEIADTDDPDGNPYGWVGGTLLSHNLIGKRVRLLVVED